jgi:hypothetical protein
MDRGLYVFETNKPSTNDSIKTIQSRYKADKYTSAIGVAENSIAKSTTLN